MDSRGLTFLEIVISLSILTVALLGYSQIYKTSLDSSYRGTREIIATNLARGLFAEIMSKNFADPEEPTNDLDQVDTGESGRNTFDDVDDYYNFDEGPPPVTIGGVAMNGAYSDFTRHVDVVFCGIDVANNIYEIPGAVAYDTSDYKKVTVTVGGPYVRDIVIDEVKTKPPE